MMSTRILIAVSQANIEPWISIWNNGQKKTWVQEKTHNVDVVTYRSKSAPFIIRKIDELHYANRPKKFLGLWQGRLDYFLTRFVSRKIPKYIFDSKNSILLVDNWSMWLLLGQRLGGLYHWFLTETDYDFLFTTNVSSYINTVNLQRIVQDFSDSDYVYAGHLMPENQSIQFVSGSGTLLSRKTVELMVKNWRRYSHSNIDDVCIGNFLRELGVVPTPLSRIEVSDVASVDLLTRRTLVTEYHFRCKSNGIVRGDIEVMKKLHSKIHQYHLGNKSDK